MLVNQIGWFEYAVILRANILRRISRQGEVSRRG